MGWRIAIGSLDGITVSEHFGRAHLFYIVDVSRNATGVFVEKREVTPVCQGGEHSESSIDTTADLLRDCAAVLVSKIGPAAQRILEEKNIMVFEKADYIDESIKKIAAYFIRVKFSENIKDHDA